MSLTLIDRPAVLCQAILYLASKSEEEHRRLRDIITVVHRMKYPTAELLHLGAEHTALRDHIVSTEQLVLRVLGFNLNVDLPYNYLYNMLYQLNASHALAKVATAVLNDFYPFNFILEFPPRTLAAAALFLAIKLSISNSTEEDSKDNGNLPNEVQKEEDKIDSKMAVSSDTTDPSTRDENAMEIQVDTNQSESHEDSQLKCSIGGGKTKIDENSKTIAFDCLKELNANIVDVIDITTRMMKNYTLPSPEPFIFDRKSEINATPEGPPTAKRQAPI